MLAIGMIIVFVAAIGRPEPLRVRPVRLSAGIDRWRSRRRARHRRGPAHRTRPGAAGGEGRLRRRRPPPPLGRRSRRGLRRDRGAGRPRPRAGRADLADAAALPALIDEARAAIGPLTLLVNNASLFEDDRIETPDRRRRWDAHMARQPARAGAAGPGLRAPGAGGLADRQHHRPAGAAPDPAVLQLRALQGRALGRHADAGPGAGAATSGSTASAPARPCPRPTRPPRTSPPRPRTSCCSGAPPRKRSPRPSPI